MRNAWAARLAQRFVFPLITLPPVILVPGHRPSQLVKCLTLGKRPMSEPISEMTVYSVNIPVAILVWFMIYPMMVQI